MPRALTALETADLETARWKRRALAAEARTKTAETAQLRAEEQADQALNLYDELLLRARDQDLELQALRAEVERYQLTRGAR